MRRPLTRFALVFPLLVAGCTEDPSYYLRWKLAPLDGSADPEAPDSAKLCSQSGLGQLRVSTYDAGTSVLADQRLVSCSPPGFPDSAQPGPELEDGDYTVRLEALRDTGGIWEREFCAPSQVPPEWDPDVPANKNDADEVDGALHCDYRDVTVSCYDPGSGCSAGAFACRCRTEAEQDGDPDDPDDDTPACDGSSLCSDDLCVPPDCEGTAGCDCRDPGDEPVCDAGTTCSDGKCVPEDDGVCGDVQAYCDLEPSKPRVIRRWYCQFAWDETSVTVVKDRDKPVLDDFLLIGPPQCDDGVDNDGDGLTDLGDPACLREPLLGREADDKAVSSISVDVTFLDENPHANCPGMGIGRLHLELDDGGGEPQLIGDIPCDTPKATFPAYSRTLPEGDYVLRLTAIQAATEDVPVATPLETEPFHVDEKVGAFVQHRFDIGPSDFLEPLESALRLGFSYQATQHDTRTCLPALGGELVISRVSFRMWERNGNAWEEMPPAALMFDLDDFNPSFVGNEITIDCPEKPVASQVLTWGNYAVSAMALSADDDMSSCFELDGADPWRLAPGSDANVVILPRMFEDDPKTPVDACLDCQFDDDCSSDTPCVDGVCGGP